jgi:hypothetical protein
VSVHRGFDVPSSVRVLFVSFFGFLFDCFVVGACEARAMPGGVVGLALASVFCLRGAFGLVVLACALASAYCLRASRVAPVRGGTYFSLPPQRKVGKRKRLTPPTCLLA